MESAALLLYGTREAENFDRSPLACAVIRFHTYRTFLVDSLRLVLKNSVDLEVEEVFRSAMQALIGVVTTDKNKKQADGSAYIRRCMAMMLQIEQWLNRLAEQAQKAVTLGQASTPDADEVMGLQQHNLTQQHESLGSILAYLVKGNYTSIADFDQLLQQMRQVDKWNTLAVHYVPALISFASQYGGTEGSVGLHEARSMHTKIVEARDARPWPLRHLQAAFITWWLAEYNSWYFDPPDDAVLQGADTERETQSRDEMLMQALRDGAFQCTLSICSQIKSSDWYSTARIGLIRSLLNDAPVLPFESASISPYFRDMVMDHFETFIYSFIANLPDTLRRFKVEEEDQRRQMLSGFQPNVQNGIGEHDRHLERFFVIMSYAYEGRPDAATTFWSDPESSLYGFLQWFSRRVSTPLVSAFCEMFRAISTGEEYASGAHTFLLDEGAGSSGRARRSASLSWAQIFEELEFYASKVRESLTTALTSSSTFNSKPKLVDIDEPETPVMLECYLRLMSHLCSQSEVVRAWIFSHPTFRVVDTAFLLSNNTVPSRIRACAFGLLQALLTSKRMELGDIVWIALDQWVSSGFSTGSTIPRPAKVVNASAWAEEVTFEAILSDFDEMNAFVSLLQALVSPSLEMAELNDALPFPEQLGSSHRMSGVEPYVDAVIGNILAVKVPQLETSLRSCILASNALQFVEIALETFNENLIILANKSNISLESTSGSSPLATYVRLHPFSRVMEWMFNDRVITALFAIAHQDISEVSNAQPESPLILALLRCIRVMNLVMDLQSTYLDIVRPLVKTQSAGRKPPVLNPSLMSFDDSVSVNLRIITDLAYYCASGNQDLALASMELLKKFSASRKLNSSQVSKIGSRTMMNRLISVLQSNNDVEPIARSMAQAMEFDLRELVLGPDSPAFHIKYSILDFLEHTLATNTDKPTIAHALLGFECTGTEVLDPSRDSLFIRRTSLFHAVLRLSLEYPGGLGKSLLYWSMTLKRKATRIIQLLWTSSLTSILVLSDLQVDRVFFSQWCLMTSINADTIFEGQSPREADFMYNDSARTLDQYLRVRCSLYEYATTALRSVILEKNPILTAQIMSTLLGSTATNEGEQANMTILDSLDIFELDPPGITSEPILEAFAGLDVSVCVELGPGDFPRFDLKLLDQLLALKRNQIRSSNRTMDEAAEEKMESERKDLLGYLNGLNNQYSLESARISALRAWADLLTLMLQSNSLEPATRSALVLQAFQVISPKMETFAYSMRPEGLIFARLAQTLLSKLDFKVSVVEAGRAAEIASDRLLQLFKISLRAITNPDASVGLREVFYNICYQYLTSFAETLEASVYRQYSSQALVAAGDRLIDIISEDAYGGAGTSRVAALLLLDSLARLPFEETPDHVINALVRTNFVIVLVEAIRDMPAELRQAHAEGKLPTPAQFHR